MKSKTPRNSKSSSKEETGSPARSSDGSPAALLQELGRELGEAARAALSVGHAPSELSPHDSALFRTFQSNFLSLISHELRTPLMGVLNALTLLDEGAPGPEFTTTEMIAMARQNAQRLHRALVTLLDLAGLESGTFHARLKEVDLSRLARNRLAAHQKEFKEKSLVLVADEFPSTPVLGDAQKLGRALDLCIQLVLARSARSSDVNVRILNGVLELEFRLPAGLEISWESSWSQGIAGFEGGLASPNSAFAGVLQSEQAFLSRVEEGLGSEFLLTHQIMRLHHGKFEAGREGATVTLRLVLSGLNSEEGLRAVLLSRAYEVSTELGSVALALVKVPVGMNAEHFCTKMKNSLFRASDGAYALPSKGVVALVLDDCKVDDAPRLLNRLETSFGIPLRFGIAHCPEDRLDPSQLIELAESRLAAFRSGG